MALNVEELLKDITIETLAGGAFKKGFCEGCQHGYEQGVQSFGEFVTARTTVTNVIFNNDKTIVKFADGEVEIVTYNPAYGYPYDKEKAIMAAMLKHISGSSYIRTLKKYGGYEYNAEIEGCIDADKHTVICDCAGIKCPYHGSMVSDDGYEQDTPENVDYTPDGLYVSSSEPEVPWRSMSDDIFDNEN